MADAEGLDVPPGNLLKVTLWFNGEAARAVDAEVAALAARARKSDVRVVRGARRAEAYRYEVTAVHGEVPGNVIVGTILRESTFVGRTHTWRLFNNETGDNIGWFTGKYLGKVES